MRKLHLLLMICCMSFPVHAQKTALMSAAQKAFEAEDYASALDFTLSAVEISEDDPEMLYMAGECNRRLFEYNTALIWLNRAATADAKCRIPLIHYRTAETLLSTGDCDGALKALNLFTSCDSSSSVKASSLRKQINDACQLLNQSDTTDLFDGGKTVNTPYSDFAPLAMNDSLFLFSSLRFESKNNETASMILNAVMNETSIDKAVLLPDNINNKSWHNCNASVSPDGKIMVFSRCNYNTEQKLICKLYESTLVNNQWQTPVQLNTEINASASTTTQPCITSAGTAGYHLFFASDRKSGKGETDLYHSIRNAKGIYSKSTPVSAANTPGKEVTPFYNPVSGILYFSSDSAGGLGALDIYKLRFEDVNSIPENAGLPFNSGYNDLYYSEILTKPGSGFISSNRPGTQELDGSVCCYDIFRFQAAKPVEKLISQIEETIVPLPVNTEQDPVILEADLRKFLPLKLFFDNDYPDPRSRKPVTKADYQQLFADYSIKLNTYIDGFGADTSRNEEDARNAVEKFFIDDLQYNYRQLDKFSKSLFKALSDSNKVELTLQGFASPLAETAYNLILSARRIASLLNYWKSWENGSLQQFIESGQLTIKEQPSGEQRTDISDKADDTANSVYHPQAARERRIEVINVIVNKP